MSYQSMEEAKLRGEKENIPFWKAIQLEDAQERDEHVELFLVSILHSPL